MVRKALGVILTGAASCAYLGGSIKYSREALEDRCGDGFRVSTAVEHESVDPKA